jgi:signal recognition particle receptor subunit beta
MVFFNHATRQMTVKIVYYGPGLCGKTTNLNTIYGKTSQKARGEMVSLNTETDRTLFFDLLPMDVGMVSGFKTKLQLYTVPGQVFYNSTRKLVLKGVDGIVFVVDSQTPMLDACKESYQNLEANLRELGLNLADIPTVFQWNKRDLRHVVPVEELEAAFNPKGTPSFQAVASDGSGVFETLRGITKLALSHIKIHVLGDTHSAVVPAPESHAHEVEALTLSDLPSVTDLLDLETPASASPAAGATPMEDEDDDSNLFIEAPTLPEPPGAMMDDDVAFLLEDEDMLPPAGPETGVLLDSRMSGSDQAFEAEPPPVVPEPPVAMETIAPVLAPAPVMAWAPSPEKPSSVKPSPVNPLPKLDPLASLASLKMAARPPVPKPKPIDHRDAINSLLGELTLAGRSGLPSVLRLEVPAEVDGPEVEVVVQLRCHGRVLAEGQVNRPLPGKGSITKLSVEIKRS